MKNTERFSSRVSDYLNYRPSYPTELVSTLNKLCVPCSGSVIADIGSGTGKLSELLLADNRKLYGVEPNKEMREAAESLLMGDKRQRGQIPANEKFVSVDGDSTKTGLADHSIDLIVVAQAFHWFDLEATKLEFNRIRKPDGFTALIWNERDTESRFQKDYDYMLTTHCAEYTVVNHRNISGDVIDEFFSPKSVKHFTFPYLQRFDETGLLGRMFSSSYTPVSNTFEFEELKVAATELFRKYENNGVIEFTYQTNLYLSGGCKP